MKKPSVFRPCHSQTCAAPRTCFEILHAVACERALDRVPNLHRRRRRCARWRRGKIGRGAALDGGGGPGAHEPFARRQPTIDARAVALDEAVAEERSAATGRVLGDVHVEQVLAVRHPRRLLRSAGTLVARGHQLAAPSYQLASNSYELAAADISKRPGQRPPAGRWRWPGDIGWCGAARSGAESAACPARQGRQGRPGTPHALRCSVVKRYRPRAPPPPWAARSLRRRCPT